MIEFFAGMWALMIVGGYGFHHRYQWRWRRLMAAISEGDLERAERVWQGLLAKIPAAQRRSAYVLYFEAGLLALREDWQAALAIADLFSNSKARLFGLSSGRELQQYRHAGKSMRARCLAELGRIDEAMQTAEEALTAPGITPPLRAGVLVSVGIVQLRRGEYERALATLEQSVALSPMKGIQASSGFYRGEALRALGREQEAIQAYQRVIAIVPLSRRAAHARQRLTQAPPSEYR